ncbi:MAG: heparinase II/III family protein [Planctomycetota bacterium]
MPASSTSQMMDPNRPLPNTPDPARVVALRESLAPHLSKLPGRAPDLLLTAERVDALRAQAADNPAITRLTATLVDRARLYLEGEPLPMLWYGQDEYRHMLETSREAVRRCTDLALAWRLTRDPALIARLAQVLDAAAVLPDWNPKHFLDTAEMMSALALGLAWAWDGLDDAARTRASQAILEKGLAPAAQAYRDDWPHLPWRALRNNWNVVCNTGVALACLACHHLEPQTCADLLATARVSVEAGLSSFVPEGAYPEGAIYWGYAVRYLAMFASGLDTALGADLGLMSLPGLARTAEYPARVLSPAGHTVCFGDQSYEDRDSHRSLAQFFFAQWHGRPEFATAEHDYLAEHPETVTPYHLVWWTPPTEVAYIPVLSDRLDGPTPLAVFRSEPDKHPRAFLSLKGGWNPESHGHLDLGTFEYHALGQRWIIDLGRDDYRLPGYWEEFDPADPSQPGKRFDWFRCSTYAHSVPVIDGAQQRMRVATALSDIETTGDASSCQLDLTDAYRDPAQSVVRRVRFHHRTGVAEVADTIDLTRPARVEWALLTPATPTVNGRRIELEQAGKRVRIEVNAPTTAEMVVESAEQSPPQAANSGVCRVVCAFDAGPGRHEIGARLIPAGQA